MEGNGALLAGAGFVDVLAEDRTWQVCASSGRFGVVFLWCVCSLCGVQILLAGATLSHFACIICLFGSRHMDRRQSCTHRVSPQ